MRLPDRALRGPAFLIIAAAVLAGTAGAANGAPHPDGWTGLAAYSSNWPWRTASQGDQAIRGTRTVENTLTPTTR